MPLLDASCSTLLLIDLQARLMPALAEGDQLIRNAQRLIRAARRLGVPVLLTEQNPRGLGPTVPELDPSPSDVVEKLSFNACAEPALGERLGKGTVVVAGAEAHVCVLQTVLALRGQGRAVHVVADAVGSRREASRAAGLARMAAHGAEIVTTEMVLFEWLGTAAHPAFREIIALIK
jgi:nicotinamidase-related amidase